MVRFEQTYSVDSFFASVTTANKFWDACLRVTAFVKTAPRMFSMPYLSNIEMQRKGDFASMISGSVKDRPVFLAVFRVDRDRRYFISSAGRSTFATPIYREKYRKLGDQKSKVCFEIPIPDDCKQYYSVCNRID